MFVFIVSVGLFSPTQNYIDYSSGKIPIVLSIPHGGSAKPFYMKNRSCSGCSYKADLNTIDLGERIAKYLKHELGGSPYIITNNIHRSKLDANREPLTGSGGPVGDNYWKLYHDYIDLALTKAVEKYSYALLIDLHGHSHRHGMLEIGYNISKTNLKNKNYSNSTIDYLEEACDIDTRSYIVGYNSLGCNYEIEGVSSVPSCVNQYPTSKYFNGGYIVEEADKKNKVIAIQLECNKKVRSTRKQRNNFARVTAKVLAKYINNVERCID